jgi:hypothetical protein
MFKRGYMVLLSWVLFAAGLILVYEAFYKGMPRTFFSYGLVLLAVLMPFALSGALAGTAGILMALPAFAAMAFISFLTIPPSGYGGQDVRNAFIAISLFSLLTAGLALGLRRRDWRPYLALVLVQALALGTFFLGAGLDLLRSIQHEGTVLPVQVLNFKGGVGLPLLEGECLYALDGDMVLHRVQLKSGSREQIARIPRLTPEQAGFPGYTYLEGSPFFRSAQITRTGAGELTILYQDHPYRSITPSHSESRYFLAKIRVQESTGAVSWQVSDESLETGYYLNPASRGSYTLTVEGARWNTFRVRGPGVDTRIWFRGFPAHLVAGPGRFCATTEGGRLYLITLPQ